jgi:hypothetical protein
MTHSSAIVCNKDPEPIKVLTKEGEMKNVLWVIINRTKYALSFNHKTGEIELRRGTLKGAVVHSFSSSTPLPEVRQTFENL